MSDAFAAAPGARPVPSIRARLAYALAVWSLLWGGVRQRQDRAGSGAARAWLEAPSPDCLRMRDDGPGVTRDRRRSLQAALDAQTYDGVTGLGLMLADRVARAHGGRLRLPEVDTGFMVELELDARTAGQGTGKG